MGYLLGVDLGTTFTAAAVDRDGTVQMATLGDRAAAVPSVVLLREDGTVLTGDAADRRAATEPDRVAREMKRRLGDPMPLLLGGAPQPVQELMAMQLREVVREVSEREGGAPDAVTLTHPANWGPYKRELFEQIPPRAGLRDVAMITEPEAAARHYASNERLPDGALVAVYDLGGGTFDATVLRTDGPGFEILGTPEGIEGLGGIDFDEAVFAHVDRVLAGAVSALDPADPGATSAAIRLRHDCVLAKEALSSDTDATVPVMLPGLQTEVRLTRGELEDMVRPAIGATIESLRRALVSAGIEPGQLHTVLLVGGSSRIPVVARMVSAEIGRPTAVDAHPKHAIALGAAAAARPRRDEHHAVAGATDTGNGHRADGAPETAGRGSAGTGPMLAAGAAEIAGSGGFSPVEGASAQPDVDGPVTIPMVRGGQGLVPAGPGAPIPQPGPGLAPVAGMPAPALAAAPADRIRRRRVPLAVAAAVLVAVAAVVGTIFLRSPSAAAPELTGRPAPVAGPTTSSEAPLTEAPQRSSVPVADEPQAPVRSAPKDNGVEPTRRQSPVVPKQNPPEHTTAPDRTSTPSTTTPPSTTGDGSGGGTDGSGTGTGTGTGGGTGNG